MARLRPALQAILSSGLALALWTLACPALAASAPFCDDRAASAIAPPPALEAPDVGIQRAKVAPACAGEDRPLGTALRHGRSPSEPAASRAEPALTPDPLPFVAPSGDRLELAPISESPRQGVRSRIERPPRV
jgi:hypothetical protein